MTEVRHSELDSIGSRLTHIRASESQRAFAEQLGVPLRTYQTFEQDKREPDLRVLTALSQRGWSLDWVLLGLGEPTFGGNRAADAPSQFVRLDAPMMGRALASVRRLLSEAGMEASSVEGEGELAAILYEMYQEGHAWNAAERSVATLMRAMNSAIKGKEPSENVQGR